MLLQQLQQHDLESEDFPPVEVDRSEIINLECLIWEIEEVLKEMK